MCGKTQILRDINAPTYLCTQRKKLQKGSVRRKGSAFIPSNSRSEQRRKVWPATSAGEHQLTCIYTQNLLILSSRSKTPVRSLKLNNPDVGARKQEEKKKEKKPNNKIDFELKKKKKKKKRNWNEGHLNIRPPHFLGILMQRVFLRDISKKKTFGKVLGRLWLFYFCFTHRYKMHC